ncbi:Bacterial leucyl aminopeptidase precursor [Rubripirellula tenax]|uniref:Bacterial leucyl aminopeptidase n=1 Tax=Rubripirellula tenax TaxID=2528015 RepID=A0A5C6EHQ1_9BACT|nr:M20/M25/M40 family metallo-hydrolase [Rubripirellula tenax]TWU48542.1 Bacterial leucyl aminopeptidase precursor [Rubripirellula tenax]
MKRFRFTSLVFVLACTSLASAQDTTATHSLTTAEMAAAEVIDEDGLRGHVRFLADDLLEGRGPGSRGDAITQLYLSTQFQTLGLSPAAGDGQWLQSVPLVGVNTNAPPTVTFRSGDENLTLKSVDDFMSTIGSPTESASVDDAELIFVGYGIQAPEYDWDDFKDADLRGKILVIMNNDPADDPELFEGSRRLYYGRWDYKYESAARQGAAGAIIIHTTPSAGYPWQVIQTSWAGEEFELRGVETPRMKLKAWSTDDAAKKIATLAGKDLDELRAAAESRDFRPVPLGVTLSIELTASVRQQDTANVIAVLPGSDPDRRDEHVVYMAHHDHLGMSAERDINGDNIYNGAIDNASGVAALLAMAKAYAQLEPRPARSIMFAAVAAEEQGLLGSRYFAADPPISAGKLAAVINMDGTNIIGRTHDVNVIGMGKSSLDAHVQAIAKAQGRIVTPDHFPDRGYYYRSDQFSLAKIGVPGVYLHSGIQVIGKPDGWGKEQLDQWVEKIYHQPSDEYLEDWDLTGAIDDTRLLFHVGRRVADAAEMPAWTAGDEFEAARQKAIAENP